MKIAGLDISINSTGKCIMELDDNFDIISINFYGYNKTNKRCLKQDNVDIQCVGTKYTSMNFFDRQNLAYGILEKNMEGVSFVAVEGYSFASEDSNRTFQIGEFCGGLKKLFYDQGKGIVIYPPSVIKYYATQKGNAQKIHMKMAFMQNDKYNKYYPRCIENLPMYEDPQSDLIDSFFICEILRNHMKFESGLELDDDTLIALSYKGKKKSMSILETIMYKKK